MKPKPRNAYAIPAKLRSGSGFHKSNSKYPNKQEDIEERVEEMKVPHGFALELFNKYQEWEKEILKVWDIPDDKERIERIFNIIDSALRRELDYWSQND